MASILIIIYRGSWLLFWFILELNMLLFIINTIVSNKLIDKLDSMRLFFYFVFQTLSSFMLLVRVRSSQYSSSFMRELLLVITFIFKIGLFPLHFWIFKLSILLSRLIFVLLMTVQKIPYILVLFSLERDIVYLFIIINIIGGLIYMYKRGGPKEITISSAIYGVIWVFFIFKYSITIFLLYISNYLLTLIFLADPTKRSILGKELSTLIIFFIFSGLPPFTFFFLKLLVFRDLRFNNIRLTYILFLSSCSALAFAVYLLFFIKRFKYTMFFQEINMSSSYHYYKIIAFIILSPLAVA